MRTKQKAILIIVLLAILSIMVVGLTSLMVYWGTHPDWTKTIGDDMYGKTMVLMKEEEVPLQDIARMSLDFTSANINVHMSDSDTLRIEQYSARDLEEEEKFTVQKDGSQIKIAEGKKRLRFSFFNFNYRADRFEIYLPRGYAGDLTAHVSSGYLDLASEDVSGLALKAVEVKSTSGRVNMPASLRADTVSVRCSSGVIETGSITAEGGIDITATSGKIVCGGVLTAADIDIETSSGNIETNGLSCSGQAAILVRSGKIGIAGENDIAAVEIHTTSGIIDVDSIHCKNYDIQATSGKIDVEELAGAGRIQTTSGMVDVTYSAMNGTNELQATSGRIKVVLAQDISFELTAKVVSGSVDANFDLTYQDKRGKNAVAAVGSAPFAQLNIEVGSGNVDITRK